MQKLDLSNDINKINEELLNSNIAIYVRPSRARSIWQLVNTLVPYAALWVVAYYVFQFSFWLTLPLILLASGFMVRIFIIFHDCGHQSFFRSHQANRFWGVITGILTFTPYHYWSLNHAKHHDTSGNLDERGLGDVWTMTVAEYKNASRRDRLKYRLYRNPIVMFFLGPLLIILVSHRIPRKNSTVQERRSVYWTDLGIGILAVLLCLFMGVKAYLAIQFLTLFIGLIGGVWLFYVQHQFEGVYWAREEDWNFIEASLKGGSFYKLPKILNWFTGSIGYHHVHHLLTGIPNYNLAKCHKQTPIKSVVKPTGILASLKSLSYRLWDEKKRKLVSFREALRAEANKEPSGTMT